MVEGGMRCVKYLLFGFNLIFFLAGLGLIIAGAVIQTKFGAYFDFFGGSFSAVSILLIVVGAIVFIIGFFGCCGAYKENYCMVMTFAVLLAIVFILEIAAGIAAYVLRDQLETFVVDTMGSTQDKYGLPDAESITNAWDSMQQDFQCCGSTNYTSWADQGALAAGAVPDSCCVSANMTYEPGCGTGQLLSPTHIYREGCLDQFVTKAEDNIYVVGAVGIGLAFIQVVGVLLACCLARTIKKEYEVV